ncbi:hypothetical protein F5Y12DRAFT_656822 [Xylaria sp. FL1777]|nr:hypothetical protein F5Y12DRAFT_656822 [Xylaria sp. FL1777]
MADTFPDFDLSNPQQDTPDGMSDALFSGVNFSENLDPEIEAGLALDFPIEKVQVSPPVILTSPSPQLEAPVSSAPDLSNAQFVNPEQLLIAPQPTYATPNFLGTNSLDMGWANTQQPLDGMLKNNSPFTTQPLANQGYPQYFPIGTQFNGQPLAYPQQLPTRINAEQAFQNPMVTQMNAQPLVYGPPIVSTQMNGQPIIHQPQQVIHQQPMNPIYQAPWPPERPLIPEPIPQGPIRQQTTLPLWPPAPKPMPPPGKGTSPKNRSPNPSSVPQPIDRSRHSREPPSAGTVTTTPLPKRPAKNHHGEALLNDKIPRKTHGRKAHPDVEPERYYGPSPPKPISWGPRDDKGRHLFTYTEKGELAPGTFFTAQQMRQYLMGPCYKDNFEPPPRLPGVKTCRKKVRQGLTLWIGWPAAMANSRYPRGGESTKCRFKNCQYARTIALGEPWVILDERQNVNGEMIDPFHNAGYVHLFCLEHHFDLIDLWHLIDVRIDCRAFKRESHPYFSLEHKLPGIDAEFRAWWIATYEIWWQFKRRGLKRMRDHDTSLAQCLINFKLDHEPKSQVKNREKRGGVDISKHRGNPELKKKLRAYQKYGLLDEMGFPVADAAAQLEVIENRRRRNVDSANSGLATPPHPIPVLNNGQQFLPYVQQVEPTFMGPVYQTTDPVYPNQPIMQDPYVLQTNTPFESAIGHKRSHETAIGEANIMTSSPKRQRLGDFTPPPPEPLNIPMVTAGDAAVSMQGELQGYNPATLVGATADFPIQVDFNHDLGHVAKGLELETQGGVPEVSPLEPPIPPHDVSQEQKLPDQGDEPPMESLPTPPDTVKSDDLDDLFGNPEDCGPSETLSNTSASPEKAVSAPLGLEPDATGPTDETINK